MPERWRIGYNDLEVSSNTLLAILRHLSGNVFVGLNPKNRRCCSYAIEGIEIFAIMGNVYIGLVLEETSDMHSKSNRRILVGSGIDFRTCNRSAYHRLTGKTPKINHRNDSIVVNIAA